MDIADGQSSEGWYFASGSTASPWRGRGGPFHLHEAYTKSDPRVSTRVTVPVLWDQRAGCIVSNDSMEILRLLSAAFAAPATPAAVNLFPSDLADDIDALHARIYAGLLNGVYKTGVPLLHGSDARVSAAAAREVVETLELVEGMLADGRPYLLGGRFTAVDLRLNMCILRFDAAYLHGFRIADLANCAGILVTGTAYPRLAEHTRRVYAMVKADVDWASFRQYYRWSPGPVPAHRSLPDLGEIVASLEGARL